MAAEPATGDISDTKAGGFFGVPLPGASPLDAQLVNRLKAAWEARSPDYKPRTRHLNSDRSPQYTNRLFLESSPYLLQHAHNPVNWYPWGDEAFETARKLRRPVLLSVGYSTCHWCHVMEEESFENEEIAQYLNENYIAIKVDREERPDIDAIYMTAVQAMTGGGGWPMTVWLTPDRKPFYGGTYFPARDGERGSPVGFLTLLTKLKAVYEMEPDRVVQSATELAQIIQTNLTPGSGGERVSEVQVLQAVVDTYRQRFDATYGGLQGAPKFPSSLPIRLLLRHYRRTNDKRSLAMVTLTLERMAAGGMYDHVGGGFHRYSTDAQWLVPHFEKMLYDNAQLLEALTTVWAGTRRPLFAQRVRET
ncbi:MAG: thioredoxin domain-containing protein, partial [Deltaproteobacteria bacterium]|nr:thioredoxin domain-containing protein [Deltaproteobacteria bacterium]